MKYSITKLLLIAFAACSVTMWQAASTDAQGTFNIDWVAPAPANYDVDGNWLYQGSPGVPGLFSGDIAVIGNAAQPTGVANITAPLASSGATDIAGLVLGSGAGSNGTLNMSAGNLAIIAESGSQGNIVVGSGGTGTLSVTGGTLSGVNATSNAASSINLSGNGSLTVNNVATLGGTTSISGTTASLNVGTLLQPGSGVYAPTITGSGVAKMNVTGQAALNGTLDVTFSGTTPSVGATWNLIEAADFHGPTFTAVNATGVNLPIGQQFRVREVATGGGRANAQLQLVELLRLQVNRDTGAMSILTGAAGTATINGYQIQASGDVFDSGAAWTKLSPSNGWQVANGSATQLAEIKSTAGGRTVSQASPLSLGNSFAPDFDSLPFGESIGQNLAFTYNTTAGETVQGAIEYIGDEFFNNFVLTIDPDNGLAELKNDSSYTVSFDSYKITSAAGELDGANWTELGGSWQVANPTQVNNGTQLAELNPSGNRTLGPGQRILLGNIFPQVGTIDPTTDLSFFAANSDPMAAIQTVNGVIRVGDVTVGGSQQGDFNGDGIVNLADYTVWRDNLGANNEGVINNAGNGNNLVDAADYGLWKSNFGAGGGALAGFTGSPANVPEPGTVALAGLGLVIAASMARRAKQG
jgi:hypothetical protein